MVGNSISRVLAGLVRRTWLVVVLATITCAVFAAHAVAALASARYLDDPPAPAPHLQVIPVVSDARAGTKDGTALVERNMFCSTCTPSPVTGSGPADSFVPDAILIATSIGTEPIATVRVPATEVQGSWGVGDLIPGIGIVDRIGFVSIDIRDTRGRTGTLSLRTPSSGRGDGDAATSAPATAASPYADRVRAIDATTFEVERNLVRDLVTGTVKPGGTRIIPIGKDGKLEGLRVAGVRPDSLAGALGLANGDLLVAVNNTKIESANTLLDLYAQLDKLDQVVLEGTRKGKPLTLTLRLR
jgi:general secretion pathway protein C